MNKKASQGDVDLFSVPDGSQTNLNEQLMTSPSNGDGEGSNPKPGNTGYKTTPFGQQGHYDEHIQTPDAPFNEDVVDENHANNTASIIFDSFIKRGQQNDQNNFLRDTIDSTDIMDEHGLIPEEELNNIGQETQIVQNNVPHGFSNADHALTHSPKSVLDKDQSDDRLVDLAPRNYPNASKIYEKFILKAEKNHESEDKSDLEKQIKPDEVQEIEDRRKQDFGTGDLTGDTIMMSSAPFEGNLVTDESSNYRGIANDSMLFFQKFIKSDYTQVVPSANVETGRDEEEAKPGQPDGKKDTYNDADKMFNDPIKYRNNLKYDTVEDTDDYFKYVSTEGEYGQEADGDHSGVSN